MFSKISLPFVKSVRTKGQLNDGDADMTTLRQIKDIANRAEATLLQDAAGAAALTVMLVVALHLPVLI